MLLWQVRAEKTNTTTAEQQSGYFTQDQQGLTELGSNKLN